jgi:hypothetical protein
MQIPAQIYAFDTAGRAYRRPVNANATIRDSRRAPNDAFVHNLSTTGCLIATDTRLALDASLSVGIPGIGVLPAQVTRIDGRLYGCAFNTPISQVMVDAALSAGVVLQLTQFEEDVQQTNADPTSMVSYDRWPRRTRVALIFGTSVALWMGLAMLI